MFLLAFTYISQWTLLNQSSKPLKNSHINLITSTKQNCKMLIHEIKSRPKLLGMYGNTKSNKISLITSNLA